MATFTKILQPNHGSQGQRSKTSIMNGTALSNGSQPSNNSSITAETQILPVTSSFSQNSQSTSSVQPKQIMTKSALISTTKPDTSSNQNASLLASPAIQNKALVSASETNGESLSGDTQAFANGITVISVGSDEDSSNNKQLANTKEKTPMCLINELARYNKIVHQYALIDEQGPAHKKTFFVELKLGEKETYSASGPSIKKAQHAAASQALVNTKYGHPPAKPARNNAKRDMNDKSGMNTPTVELNALLMKRGEQAIYKPLDTRSPNYYPHQNYNYRPMYNGRYQYRVRRSIYVSLKVGAREFIGEGSSRQDARHDAASKALAFLSKLPLPAEEKKPVETQKFEKEEDDDDPENLKSEISLVHEIALKRNLNVNFDVIRESGPPHMKMFVTRCKVGEFETESEGQSKKISKKKSAELMLEKLKDLPCLPPTLQRLKTKPNTKKKAKNIIKQMQKANPDYGVGINPISRLIQIQQAQQKKEPVYTLVTERGLPRRREFVIQVAVDDQVCTGVGPNKKLAKRHAAEAMLTLLGYNKPSPQPAKPAIKTNSTTPDTPTGEKKVTFVENTEEQSAKGEVTNGKIGKHRQVPGIIRLPDASFSSGNNIFPAQNVTAMGDSNATKGFSAEARLRDITTRNQVEIKFEEFSASGPGSTEILSRVTFSTNPPRTFHGSGPFVEAARDAAALEALKFLADFGKESTKKPAAGEQQTS